MSKFKNLIEIIRAAIAKKYSEISYNGAGHQIVTIATQLTTKELKAALLEHGEYVKVMASAGIWSCKINKKNLGAGVYSVWLSTVVRKDS